MESGDIVLLLPSLMAFTGVGDCRQRDAAQEASEEKKLERASSACSQARGVKVAARNLLAEPRSAGSEETWNTLVTTFPSEDHAAVSAVAADAVLAGATEGEDGHAPPWPPDNEYAPEVLFNVTSSRGILSDLGNDGQRFAQLQSIIHANIVQEEFVRGMTAFWRRIIDEPDGFPPEFWQLFLQSSFPALGKCAGCLRGHDMEKAHHRRGYATVAAAVGGGQPRGKAVWGRRTRRSGACGSHG